MHGTGRSQRPAVGKAFEPQNRRHHAERQWGKQGPNSEATKEDQLGVKLEKEPRTYDL